MSARRSRRRRKWTVRFSKVAVLALLASVAAFTVVMIWIYLKTGGVPDTLVASFYAFAGGEAGFLGLIKHSETKYGDKTGDAGEEDTAAG